MTNKEILIQFTNRNRSKINGLFRLKTVFLLRLKSQILIQFIEKIAQTIFALLLIGAAYALSKLTYVWYPIRSVYLEYNAKIKILYAKLLSWY